MRFSSEDSVRLAAVDALKLRRDKDYTATLAQGLRYPLPAVARRAADAVVRLERADLVPQLVDLLAQPDPRLPVTELVGNKKVPVVRLLRCVRASCPL
jgi:HEAT repeat protein